MIAAWAVKKLPHVASEPDGSNKYPEAAKSTAVI